jgi:hypothetical protein
MNMKRVRYFPQKRMRMRRRRWRIPNRLGNELGFQKKSHYKVFEFSGNRYTIVSDFFLDNMNGFRRFVFELKVLVFLFSVFRVKAGKKLGLAFGLLAFLTFSWWDFGVLSNFLG